MASAQSGPQGKHQIQAQRAQVSDKHQDAEAHLFVGHLVMGMATMFSVSLCYLAWSMFIHAEATQHPVTMSAECMHAGGGGRVSLQGTWPYAQTKACLQQQAAYAGGFAANGDYLAEVNATAHAAMDALGLLGSWAHAQAPEAPQPHPNSLFVFDIDETALSNLGTLSRTALDARLMVKVKQDINAEAPPLLAVRELYLALRTKGYSLAFVTGRSDPDRAATVQNLAAAGYGSPCIGDGSHIAPPPALSANAARQCCAALLMRPHGDTRLASVYKPAARLALQQAGYSLVGSIGDQFSDLSGTSSAEYSFKLPNVWYYIL